MWVGLTQSAEVLNRKILRFPRRREYSTSRQSMNLNHGTDPSLGLQILDPPASTITWNNFLKSLHIHTYTRARTHTPPTGSVSLRTWPGDLCNFSFELPLQWPPCSWVWCDKSQPPARYEEVSFSANMNGPLHYLKSFPVRFLGYMVHHPGDPATSLGSLPSSSDT